MQAGLTACLIVRDEERHLPDCLDSLRACPAVEEICVLDTGSTDRTIEIASTAGARVQQWAWRDDFAAARNRALDMARSAWVLVIDADERLQADAAGLGAWLQRAHAGAFDALVVDVEVIRDGRVERTAPSLRLLRRETMLYRGRIHEVPGRKDGRQVQALHLDSDAARLTHVGYDSPAAMDRRRARNLELADREVVTHRSTGDRVALTTSLVHRGRARATGAETTVDGLEDWMEAWCLRAGTPFRQWAGELAVGALVDAGRAAEAAPILQELTVLEADPANIAWLSGRVLRSMGRLADARTCFAHAERRRTAMGERPSDLPVLVARMHAEWDLDDAVAAAATAASIAVRFHHVGALKVLLRLTGDLPTATAHLLSQCVTDKKQAADLVALLQSQGDEGIAVARIIAGRSDFLVGSPDLQGSSSGAKKLG